MKKLKFLLPLILALAMVFTIPFATACKKRDKNGGQLISISLDTSRVRQQFLRGEEFSSERLVVTAEVKKSKSTETIDVTESADVDSSAFVNTTYGTYAIKVSYTLSGKTKEAEYNVSVVETIFDGLKVTFPDDTNSKTVALSATMSTATIDPAELKVRKADATQEGEPLDYSEYTWELWKEDEKVADSFLENGVYKNLTGGVYQLWAYADSKEGPAGYQLKGFATVIVADEVTSISVDQNGQDTQELGLDIISSKWTYTVSYISGASKTITKNDVRLIMFDTKVVGANKNAVVRYDEINAAGDSKFVTVNIKYTITASQLTTLPTESFIVKNIANASDEFATIIPTDSDGVGGVIEDNTLFTLTTQGEMKWTEATGSATSPAKKWIENVTLQDGTTVIDKFDVGLSQATATAGGDETSTITFKAKTDINLKIYLTLCNAVYNSDRPGTLIATITKADGSVSVSEIDGIGAKRENMTDISFDLYEGDVLVIKIKNKRLDATASMWLFGAEATGYKAVGGGN
ncbi:MAG: hypothetical protein K2K60_00330 [Clostridia bacterium]|nr:hypothetical protein [Clostridia bacterium]